MRKAEGAWEMGNGKAKQEQVLKGIGLLADGPERGFDASGHMQLQNRNSCNQTHETGPK